MDRAITMNGVRKTFGRKVAVEGLDLDIPMGSLVGFIGPNGAGKTTTIRMIMAILFPDSGELTVLGRKSAVESKDRIGYLPEERGVYKKMKVGAFLRYTGRLKGVPQRGLNDKISAWLKKVELPDVWNKKCEELSKGMQQKVQFISAVLHEPDLLILDEPFSGLDPVNMRLLRDLIQELHDRGTTIIFSTHVMAQAQQLCEHIVMIHNGHKVLDNPLRDIRAGHTPRAVWFEPLLDDFVPAPIESLPEIDSVRLADGHYEAVLSGGAAPADAVSAIASAAPMARVELHRPTLEDIFIDIVQGEGHDAGETGGEALRASLRADSSPVAAEEVSR